MQPHPILRRFIDLNSLTKVSLTLFLILLLSACGPSQDEITNQIEESVLSTISSIPTSTEIVVVETKVVTVIVKETVVVTATHTPTPINTQTSTPTLGPSPTPTEEPTPTIDTTGYSVSQVRNMINKHYVMEPDYYEGWDESFTYDGFELIGSVSYDVNSNNRVNAVQALIKFSIDVSNLELDVGTHILNFPFYLTGDDQLDAFVDSCVTNAQPQTRTINGNKVEVDIDYSQRGFIKISVRAFFN